MRESDRLLAIGWKVLKTFLMGVIPLPLAVLEGFSPSYLSFSFSCRPNCSLWVLPHQVDSQETRLDLEYMNFILIFIVFCQSVTSLSWISLF